MKRVFLVLAASLFAASAAHAGDRYKVVDKGGFGSTGRFIEFASRYGWQSYEIEYDFGLDMADRRLTRRSTLELTITKTDGSKWSYRCKASDRDRMWANINKLYGKGVSVMTECRIRPKKFAKSVELDADLVGEPTLVFHVMITGNEARPGIHKGFYFVEGAQIEAGTMRQYASSSADPSQLGVLFASKMAPYAHHPTFARTPGFHP